MAEIAPRFTFCVKGRYWYFRHKLYGRGKLPGQPGEAAFHVKYAECLAIVEQRGGRKTAAGDTFAWLIGEYRRSAEFEALSDATQLDYGRTLDLLVAALGDVRFAYTDKAMLKAVRDDYRATPRKAHKIKQMLSRLYSWADEAGHVPDGFNPAGGIKRLKTKGGTKEYVVWSPAEFDQFFKGAIGPMRTAVMLARYTGQRAADVAAMTWSQFQGDVIRVRQSKTRALLDVACHSALRTYLDALRRGLDRDGKRGVMILTAASGQPYNANSLSSAIGREVVKVGLSGRSIHGLRYMAGSDMEEAGCTVAEIESVLGHQTFKMALKYASQRLRAKAAADKLEANK